MSEPIFYKPACRPSLAEIVAWTGALAPEVADLAMLIHGVAALDQAGAGDLVFLDNAKYASDLGQTRATACLVARRHAGRVPATTVALVTEQPYRAFATVVGRLYPDALRPGSLFATTGVSPGSTVHPEARLEADVTVDPGAVIGPRAEIGTGTVIGPNTVIGPDVRIGRRCSVGPNGSIVNALVGDRVILHAGVRIGQDGFGFALGPRGHLKVPQVGRVIIQDDVEIGAGSTIDRGANRDTLIGEGTKIDNLVQIGHNVVIGRHCVVVSQVGISGSTTLGDFVAIGGQAGLVGHLTIGAGAQIGAQAGLMVDIPAGQRWGGTPAQPLRDHHREVVTLRKLARSSGNSGKPESSSP